MKNTEYFRYLQHVLPLSSTPIIIHKFEKLIIFTSVLIQFYEEKQKKNDNLKNCQMPHISACDTEHELSFFSRSIHQHLMQQDRIHRLVMTETWLRRTVLQADC